MSKVLMGVLLTSGLSGVTAAVILATAHDATLATGEAVVLAISALKDHPLAWALVVCWLATICRDAAREIANRVVRVLVIPLVFLERWAERQLEAADWRGVNKDLDRSAVRRPAEGERQNGPEN